jgi:TPR repeat protein
MQQVHSQNIGAAYVSADSKFIRGDQECEKGNFEKAFKIFLDLAKGGKPSAMTRIANMYTCGEGVRCDYDKAIYWEKKAVDSGDRSALMNLGISYRIKGDMVAAKYWFETSLEKGDDDAALELAKLYMVSEKETEKVKYYLDIVANSNTACIASSEEAKSIIASL